VTGPAEQPESITVVVADDHCVFRLGLREFLEELPGVHVVAEADTGESAVREAIQHRPDVVLMDIRMPEMDGIAATREIKAELPDTEVLVLSAFDGEEQIVEALEAGARGYLLKDDDPGTMANAIRTASAGRLYLGPTLAKRILERIAREPFAPPSPKSTRRGELTPNEVEILRNLTQGRKVREVASLFNVSERTMRNHLRSIFLKLGVRDRTQAVIQAIRVGLVQL
jgi:DNA-binding NarL/FixJ family response regulator